MVDLERAVWVAICRQNCFRLIEALGRIDVAYITNGLAQMLVEAAVIAACPQDGNGTISALLEESERCEPGSGKKLIEQLVQAIEAEDFVSFQKYVARIRHDAPDTSRAALRQLLGDLLASRGMADLAAASVALSPLVLGQGQIPA